MDTKALWAGSQSIESLCTYLTVCVEGQMECNPINSSSTQASLAHFDVPHFIFHAQLTTMVLIRHKSVE